MEDTRNEVVQNNNVYPKEKISTKENIKRFIYRNLMILAIIVLYVVFAWIFNIECPIRRMIRRPCPACGITRAWANVLRLDFKEAMYFHPLFWFVPFYVWVIINREVWPIEKIPAKLYNAFAVIGAVIIFGVYIFRNIVGFGDI